MKLEAFDHLSWFGVMVDNSLDTHWDIAQMAVWCRKTYGLPNMRADSTIDRVRWRDQLYDGILYFRDETDRTLFIMRWS